MGPNTNPNTNFTFLPSLGTIILVITFYLNKQTTSLHLLVSPYIAFLVLLTKINKKNTNIDG